MGVITRNVGKRKYAYLVVREGKKVVHKYIGPAENPQTAQLMLYRKETLAIPERLRTLFWDTSLNKIHIKRNARYIIEKILEYGDLDAVEWLERVYPVRIIVDTLCLSRNISEKSRNFWMIWFGVAGA
ncbi:MAG: hypothetical protein AB1478_12205 [Nitrospirota bacterium]